MAKKILACVLLFGGWLLCVLAKFDVFSPNHSLNSSGDDSVQPVYTVESVKNKEATKSETSKNETVQQEGASESITVFSIKFAGDEEKEVTFDENDMYFPECSDLPLPDNADTYRCIRYDSNHEGCYTYSFFLGTTDNETGKKIFKSYVKKLKNNGFTTNYTGDYNDAHWAACWHGAYNEEKDCSISFRGAYKGKESERILMVSIQK